MFVLLQKYNFEPIRSESFFHILSNYFKVQSSVQVNWRNHEGTGNLPLKRCNRISYLKTLFVLHSKHFPAWLYYSCVGWKLHKVTTRLWKVNSFCFVQLVREVEQRSQMKKAQRRTQKGRSCLYRWLRQRMRHLVNPGLATMSPKVKLLPDCILHMCLMWLDCGLGACKYLLLHSIWRLQHVVLL